MLPMYIANGKSFLSVYCANVNVSLVPYGRHPSKLPSSMGSRPLLMHGSLVHPSLHPK